MGELRNHFREAMSNGYVEAGVGDKYLIKMNEVGYLLSRMMKNVRMARDSYENEKKSKHFSSRRLTSSLRKQANFHSRSESIPSEG
jgi:hypothetical protein